MRHCVSSYVILCAAALVVSQCEKQKKYQPKQNILIVIVIHIRNISQNLVVKQYLSKFLGIHICLAQSRRQYV